jgi:hypothetical protein
LELGQGDQYGNVLAARQAKELQAGAQQTDRSVGEGKLALQARHLFTRTTVPAGEERI